MLSIWVLTCTLLSAVRVDYMNLVEITCCPDAHYVITNTNNLLSSPQTPTSPRRASSWSIRRTGMKAVVTITATKRRVSVTRTSVRPTPPARRYQCISAKRRGMAGALHGLQWFLHAVAPVLRTLWCTRPTVGRHQGRHTPPTRHY